MTEAEIWEAFGRGFDCGQVVFAWAGPKLGYTKKQALRLAAGFGGGMFAGDACGAVTGAVIALGARYGHCKPADIEGKEDIKRKVAAFRAGFCQKMGATQCREILGYDISLPHERQIVLDKGLMRQCCPLAVATAIGLLEELL